MATKSFGDYAHSCQRKLFYPTKSEAKRAKSRMSKQTGEPFSVYRCEYCQGYHLGHRLGMHSNPYLNFGSQPEIC